MATITDPAQRKAIAAANLSQLQYFIQPDGVGATITIPVGGALQNILIKESLKEIGFDLARGDYPDHENREIYSAGGCAARAFEDGLGLTPVTLFFDKKGIERLVDNGVSTPTLDAFRGRTPAALKAL